MKAKFVVSFLLVFITSYVINAQSVYRLKYKSPHTNDGITYDAFFAIYDNGSGFVRISYLTPGTGKNVGVELEIQEQYAMNKEGVTDTTQLVYEGVNPIFIPDNSALSFIPVTFWFKMDPENKRYEPRAVTATAGDEVSGNTNLLSAELLMDKDHIKEVASRFFTKKDEYYKNLTAVGSRGGATLTEIERKTKMFLLIVASTYDKEIGLSCLIDARKAIATFDSVSKFLGIRKNMIVDSIYGDKFNKKNVDAAIERLKLKPGPGDIVVFYYSGHGFTNPEMDNKNFPFMDLRDPRLLKDSNLIRLKKVPRAEDHTMNIEDIYERIKKMPGRFKLVISDCCNDRILYKNVKAPPPPQPPRVRGEEKWNFDNAKTLFMSKERLALLMTAASKGERATSNDNYGGFFTNNFLSSLKTYLLQSNRNANWARIMADAQKLTIFQAKRTYCPLPENPKNICHQTPLSPKIN